jgi:hypothetical protein
MSWRRTCTDMMGWSKTFCKCGKPALLGSGEPELGQIAVVKTYPRVAVPEYMLREAEE